MMWCKLLILTGKLNKMNQIDVTEFIRPNGRKEIRTLTVDDETFQKYNELIQLNFRVTVERIDSVVSLCIENHYADFKSKLIKYNPNIETNICNFIKEFNKEEAEKFIKLYEN